MSVAKEVSVQTQAYFCFTLMDRLERSASRWAEAGCPDYTKYGDGLMAEGATKTQIKNDIVRLRRELNRLAKEVG